MQINWIQPCPELLLCGGEEEFHVLLEFSFRGDVGARSSDAAVAEYQEGGQSGKSGHGNRDEPAKHRGEGMLPGLSECGSPRGKPRRSCHGVSGCILGKKIPDGVVLCGVVLGMVVPLHGLPNVITPNHPPGCKKKRRTGKSPSF